MDQLVAATLSGALRGIGNRLFVGRKAPVLTWNLLKRQLAFPECLRVPETPVQLETHEQL